MKKRMISYFFVFLLAVCQVGTFPVSVKATEADSQVTEQENEYLDFALSIEEQMATTFLMGEVTLPYTLVSDEKIKAEVYASTDGKTFTPVPYHDWDVLGQKTKRICMFPTLSPLKEYLNGEIKSLSVYLEVVHPDGTIQRTKTAEIGVPDETVPPTAIETDGILAEAGFPDILRKRISPGHYYGAYHVTATESTEVSDYEAYLPETIPVELQFYQQDSSAWQTEYVEYGVVWDTQNPNQLLEGEYAGCYQYEAASLTPPQESFIFTYNYNQKKYELSADKYPQTLLQPESAFSKLYCIVHPVEKGHQTELKLSMSEDDKNLCATLPLKPTDTICIVAFTSVNDGAERFQGEINLTDYPVNAIPNQPEYTVSLLSAEQADALLEEGNGSFQVKLMIYGGPLGNAVSGQFTYSSPAVWSGESDYIPPDDPTDNTGGEGNQGNAGTDNSGDTDGVRPGVDNILGNSPAEPPEEDTETKEDTPINPPEEDTEIKEDAPSSPPEENTETKEDTPSSPPEENTETKEDTPISPPEENTESKDNIPISPPQTDTESNDTIPVNPPQQETTPSEEILVNPPQNDDRLNEPPTEAVIQEEPSSEASETETEDLPENEVSSEEISDSFDEDKIIQDRHNKKQAVAAGAIVVAAAGAAAVKSGLLAKLIAIISKWFHP